MNRKLEDSVRPLAVLEVKPLPSWTEDERAVYELLSQQREWHASPVGLTRWIRRNKDARRADKAIQEAAENLWANGLLNKDRVGNYFYGGGQT